MEELDEALKHAKNRKSPKLDYLPMKLFKFEGNYLKVHILELFNNTVDKTQIPQEWETGIQINIHKKGSKGKCENYRGIYIKACSLQNVYKHNKKQSKCPSGRGNGRGTVWL
jgi:hypothetical protein